MKLTRTALMGLFFSLLASGEARAANFTFTKIADTGGAFSQFFDSPSLNDRETVAFRAQKEFYTGIFTDSGGNLTTIVRDDLDPIIVLGLKNSPAVEQIELNLD